MDKKFVLFGILASILIGGSFGIFTIEDSFALDHSDSREDSEVYKKQLEKAEEEKRKAEERKQTAEERKLTAEEKRKELEKKQEERKLKAEEIRKQLEEKQEERKLTAEEIRKQLEEKQEERKLKAKEKAEERKLTAEEKRKELEKKKMKLEFDRKRLIEKLSEKANKYEEKLREIKEKYQNKIESDLLGDVEKFSDATAKLEDKLAKKSEKIREKLSEKLEKLDSRTQKILDKINEGNYLGEKIGSSNTLETYELVFDSVDATAISDKTQTSSLSGFMSFTTFDKGKSNLKLELQECQITVDDIPYSCGFGKARTISSGDSGAKDSLVIIAFLEDDVIEEVHSTLKIFLNADTSISDIDGSTQVSILGPQSKISHMWFLDGTGTLTKTISVLDESTGNEISVELDEDIGLEN